MTRPDDDYARCSQGCGCHTDTEEDDGYPDDMPDDLTPGERLLWAIFGHKPPDPEEENDDD
ncbi:hypothetical protein [Paeniglutamicibacter terrestris]|uniref:Uncharacterized protein n=1 Tax=Paeniglutamicibacter terrestris TaxID=2723403 RepID=A0ABX1G5Y5_9MICC|nr:hypothetical protein [Paeniglutamicibacter terrestris]NKG21060.1 hypothetical protein [Paeniglutamicibacter terrestris]